MSTDIRVALVTGSTRGIGRECARVLAEQGWLVGVNGRSREAVERVVKEVGDAAFAVPFDATDERAVLDGIANFRRATGGLNAVVHCVGTMRDAPLGMLTRELIDVELASNVVSALLVTQAAARVLARSGGSIVLIGSVVGEDGAAGQTLYAATKAAIGGIVRSSAKELGPRGVRVNGVVPGIIATDLTAELSADRREAFALAASLRRTGEVGDVADVVAFLLSDHARFITGELVRVTGGLTLP